MLGSSEGQKRPKREQNRKNVIIAFFWDTLYTSADVAKHSLCPALKSIISPSIYFKVPSVPSLSDAQEHLASPFYVLLPSL